MSRSGRTGPALPLSKEVPNRAHIQKKKKIVFEGAHCAGIDALKNVEVLIRMALDRKLGGRDADDCSSASSPMANITIVCVDVENMEHPPREMYEAGIAWLHLAELVGLDQGAHCAAIDALTNVEVLVRMAFDRQLGGRQSSASPPMANITIVCVDVESQEHPPREMYEAGVAWLHLAELVGVDPGTNFRNWLRKIKHRQVRVREHKNALNRTYVYGDPKWYENLGFGRADWGETPSDVGPFIERIMCVAVESQEHPPREMYEAGIAWLHLAELRGVDRARTIATGSGRSNTARSEYARFARL